MVEHRPRPMRMSHWMFLSPSHNCPAESSGSLGVQLSTGTQHSEVARATFGQLSSGWRARQDLPIDPEGVALSGGHGAQSPVNTEVGDGTRRCAPRQFIGGRSRINADATKRKATNRCPWFVLVLRRGEYVP